MWKVLSTNTSSWHFLESFIQHSKDTHSSQVNREHLPRQILVWATKSIFLKGYNSYKVGYLTTVRLTCKSITKRYLQNQPLFGHYITLHWRLSESVKVERKFICHTFKEKMLKHDSLFFSSQTEPENWILTMVVFYHSNLFLKEKQDYGGCILKRLIINVDLGN